MWAGFRALSIGKGGYRQAFLRLFYDNNWWFYLYSSYLSYVITSESMKKYMYIVYIYYIYNKFIIIILYIILIVILVVTIQSPSLHFTRWYSGEGKGAKIIVSIVSIVPTPSLFTRPGSRKISKAFAQEFEAPLANTLFSPSENRSQQGRNR